MVDIRCLFSKTFILLFVGVTLFPMTAAAKGGTLYLKAMAPFTKDAGESGNVRHECQLQTKVPKFIASYAKRSFDEIKLVNNVPKASSGKILVVKITGISGLAGGAWTGPKSLTISGVMTENGKQVADFVAMRTTGGGAYAAFKGTCSFFGRDAKALGKDVARWLKAPVPGAYLGEYR